MSLARAILHLYPKRWRVRYEDEALALVEDVGLSPLAAVDLVAGAFLEHVRATLAAISNLLATPAGDVRALPLRLRLGILCGVLLIPVVGVVTLHFAGIAASRWLFTAPPRLQGKSILIFTTIYFAGQVRLASLRRPPRVSRAERQFLEDIDRYRLPRFNRAFAIATHRLMPADPFAILRPARFRPAEALAWLMVVAAAFLTVEWAAAAPTTSDFPVLPGEITLSICAAGFFLSVIFASAAYQRRET